MLSNITLTKILAKPIIFKENWQVFWPILIPFKLYKIQKNPSPIWQNKIFQPSIPIITMHNWNSNLTSSTPSLKFLLKASFKALKKKSKETPKWSIPTSVLNKNYFKKDFSPEVKAEAETKTKSQSHLQNHSLIEADIMQASISFLTFKWYFF